ncbi:DUF4269 domain-containing protein [Labrys miyagiensis]|uniref:DUF4269 domain-containing protein n=1 Tax=Labrys miyagiensis TaxID=346912 RepID=UPI0024E0B9CB|nr:DUF4269 domain-containing protein [Labrys miyagiensis]
MRETRLLETLADFDPHIAGTPPLGLDVPESDIDILCQMPDPLLFAAQIWARLSACDTFSMHQWTGGRRTIVASFRSHDWLFGIFGDRRAVAEQEGWRHFVVEQRLLRLGGQMLKESIMRLRYSGMKTEPAFAAALGLEGDPYEQMLRLFDETDDQLKARLLRTRRHPHRGRGRARR